MPNRILRDTTDSEKVNSLSPQAEVIFYRLMMKADDYGVFHAKPSLIKAALFPLRLDTVREADISRWIAECEKAGLIAFYEADSKPFLVIMNFGQRMRNMKKRFPDPPPEILRQLAATRGNSRPEVEVEVETETETESEVRARAEIFKIFLKNFSKYFPAECNRLERELESGVSEKYVFSKRNAIVAAALEKFWNHYEKTGWKTSKGVVITNRVAAFRSWMDREKQFAK